MTIAEVGGLHGLSADTLRYYERIGLIPAVGRTPGGIRNYTERDSNWIGFIKCMRGAGVQVGALIEYVTLFAQGDSTAEAREQILVRERSRIAAQMADMQKTLDRLNVKIERYEQLVFPVEKDLISL